MKKYKLYSTHSGWDNKHTALMEHLGLPNGKTARYAEQTKVQNPSSDDFEKFIMPVLMSGKWKCDDQFTASELEDWQTDWDIPLE